VVRDAAGNLYGTTAFGGNASCNCGVVFELSPNSSGGWSETVLYTFTNGSDGGVPFGGLTFDTAGNLYGTAASRGNLAQCGGSGCGSNKTDGGVPAGLLIFDGAGNLYAPCDVVPTPQPGSDGQSSEDNATTINDIAIVKSPAAGSHAISFQPPARVGESRRNRLI
jgi:uncharacterized repeat protein (TIGR03803 family)